MPKTYNSNILDTRKRRIACPRCANDRVLKLVCKRCNKTGYVIGGLGACESVHIEEQQQPWLHNCQCSICRLIRLEILPKPRNVDYLGRT